MVSTRPLSLAALALSDRSNNQNAIDKVSFAPLWRVLLLIVALSLPVLGSAVANRLPGGGLRGAVGALAVPHSPLGGTARKPGTFTMPGAVAR